MKVMRQWQRAASCGRKVPPGIDPEVTPGQDTLAVWASLQVKLDFLRPKALLPHGPLQAPPYF